METYSPQKRKNGQRSRSSRYLFAVLLVVICAILSDAIWIFMQQRQSQNAADAAALQFAYALCVDHENPRQIAEDAARDNGYGDRFEGIALSTSVSRFKTETHRGNRLTLTVHYEIQTHFIGLIVPDLIAEATSPEVTCSLPYNNGTALPPTIWIPY